MKLRIYRHPIKNYNMFIEYREGDDKFLDLLVNGTRQIFPVDYRVNIRVNTDSNGRNHYYNQLNAEFFTPGIIISVDQHSDLHCSDGPALFSPFNGYREWYLYGVKVTAMDVFEQLNPEQKERAIWELNQWR